MKYKLIKEYPGSPKLNTEIVYSTIYTHCNKENYNLNRNTYMIKSKDYFELKNPEQYPEFWEKVVEKDYEILFTTEDGVDKYLGDSFAYINLNFPDKVREDYIRNLSYQEHVKYFSTKEVAEEYILMNKPSLSLNDVASVYKGLNKKTNHPSSQANQLKQLVRDKIRQSV